MFVIVLSKCLISVSYIVSISCHVSRWLTCLLDRKRITKSQLANTFIIALKYFTKTLCQNLFKKYGKYISRYAHIFILFKINV